MTFDEVRRAGVAKAQGPIWEGTVMIAALWIPQVEIGRGSSGQIIPSHWELYEYPNPDLTRGTDMLLESLYHSAKKWGCLGLNSDKDSAVFFLRPEKDA